MAQPEPARRFRVALTRDFYKEDCSLKFREMGLDVIRGQDHIELVPFQEHRAEIGPDQIRGVQGVVVSAPRVTARTLAENDDLLAVARFGVGYDKCRCQGVQRGGCAPLYHPRRGGSAHGRGDGRLDPCPEP
jgi:phosphoglycerate dehydrogenase-like enzyme